MRERRERDVKKKMGLRWNRELEGGEEQDSMEMEMQSKVNKIQIIYKENRYSTPSYVVF
jgi:hypothetical protein